MHFEPNATYHVYNRSNEKIFSTDDNYIFFLNKTKRLIKPLCHILAWCLMPNHFHILLSVKPNGCELVNEKHREQTQQLSKNFGTLLSSYTQAFNKRNKRRGKLFAHNTKAKNINELAGNTDYLWSCFNYIHQNPFVAGLCNNMKYWEYSSYLEYAGLRNGNLVNKELALEMLPINLDEFEQQSLAIIDEKVVKAFY